MQIYSCAVCKKQMIECKDGFGGSRVHSRGQPHFHVILLNILCIIKGYSFLNWASEASDCGYNALSKVWHKLVENNTMHCPFNPKWFIRCPHFLGEEEEEEGHINETKDLMHMCYENRSGLTSKKQLMPRRESKLTERLMKVGRKSRARLTERFLYKVNIVLLVLSFSSRRSWDFECWYFPSSRSFEAQTCVSWF